MGRPSCSKLRNLGRCGHSHCAKGQVLANAGLRRNHHSSPPRLAHTHSMVAHALPKPPCGAKPPLPNTSNQLIKMLSTRAPSATTIMGLVCPRLAL